MNEQKLRTALSEISLALKRITMTVFPCPNKELQTDIDKFAYLDVVQHIEAIDKLLSEKPNLDFPRGSHEL